jgi:hypothetical protein
MDREIDIIYWNDLRSKLKLKYPMLTNADLYWRHGTKEDLLDMIALKLGKTYKELQDIIAKF